MSSVWPVNTLFQKGGKSGFFQTQLEAKLSKNILPLDFGKKFKYIFFCFSLSLYLEHLEINEGVTTEFPATLKLYPRQKSWIIKWIHCYPFYTRFLLSLMCDSHFDPDKQARISPEQHIIH